MTTTIAEQTETTEITLEDETVEDETAENTDTSTLEIDNIRFNINAGILQEALKAILPLIPGKPTHPILGFYKLDVQEDVLRVTAFDLSYAGVAEIKSFDMSKFGSVCVPAKLFHEIISGFGYQDIEILSIPHQSTLVVRNNRSSDYVLKVLNAAEYPEIPQVENGVQFSLQKEDFDGIIDSTLFSCANDEAKGVLTSLNFQFQESNLDVASTDGHRLSWKSIDQDFSSVGEEGNFNIPAKFLTSLNKSVGSFSFGDKECINVNLGKNICSFYTEGVDYNLCLITRIMEGQYPSYKLLVPAKYEHSISLNRKVVIFALERVSIFSDIVKFSFEDTETIKISSGVEDSDNFAQEKIPTTSTRFDFSFGFNTRYFIQGLKSFSEEEIMLYFNTAENPFVVCNKNSFAESDHRYLIMPTVKLRS